MVRIVLRTSSEPAVKKAPPKPKRRSARKVQAVKPVTPFYDWSYQLKDYVKDKFNLELVDEDNRADIMGEGWRIAVVAMMNEEFCVNLYCNYDRKDHEMTMVKIEHITCNALLKSVGFLLEHKEFFYAD